MICFIVLDAKIMSLNNVNVLNIVNNINNMYDIILNTNMLIFQPVIIQKYIML